MVILAYVFMILYAGSAQTQGYYEFLGVPRPVGDKFSPRHGIRYNTQGYDQPDVNTIWSSANAGWLRHARDLIKWEMGNFFAAKLGVQAEPRADGWPGTAPSHYA
ncbi:MAG TPA: hypothetical protein VN937_17285 [Blastocatellia bacterium]|nr:hypothetical protein [Blastocatellia bacterium]